MIEVEYEDAVDDLFVGRNASEEAMVMAVSRATTMNEICRCMIRVAAEACRAQTSLCLKRYNILQLFIEVWDQWQQWRVPLLSSNITSFTSSVGVDSTPDR